ncbi:MAG TPA: M20 family metallopeptidase [Bordetella sp.]|nr:M20 family metallopeptidase [Bordetella sp.]
MDQSLRRALLGWLDDHRSEMLRLLEEAVNIDSGSHDKAGVDRVQALFREHLESAGIATQVHKMDKHGNCLSAEVPGPRTAADKYVLLLGHMDTVFPAGTARVRPFRIEANNAYGPGVADMKSGLVMNTFIARAFAEVGGDHPPVRVLYTGDEEIASPSSRNLTLEFARQALAAFNAEPGRPSGNIVTGRKGALFFDFEVGGVAAHAGVNHAQGASAIEAMARKIVALHSLTGSEDGITTNVGTMRGGMSVNTVADLAVAQLDVRYTERHDRERLRERIYQIIEDESVSCTCGRVTQEGSFLPFAATDASKKLLKKYQDQSLSLGYSVHGEYAGGSADSGLTSSVGVPTLCAVGPVGAGYHTVDEVCRIDTLAPRAQAVAMMILEGCDVD